MIVLKNPTRFLLSICAKYNKYLYFISVLTNRHNGLEYGMPYTKGVKSNLLFSMKYLYNKGQRNKVCIIDCL